MPDQWERGSGNFGQNPQFAPEEEFIINKSPMELAPRLHSLGVHPKTIVDVESRLHLPRRSIHVIEGTFSMSSMEPDPSSVVTYIDYEDQMN